MRRLLTWNFSQPFSTMYSVARKLNQGSNSWMTRPVPQGIPMLSTQGGRKEEHFPKHGVSMLRCSGRTVSLHSKQTDRDGRVHRIEYDCKAKCIEGKRHLRSDAIHTRDCAGGAWRVQRLAAQWPGSHTRLCRRRRRVACAEPERPQRCGLSSKYGAHVCGCGNRSFGNGRNGYPELRLMQRRSSAGAS